jgi:4-amino-4-deoxy-L-arabinose transferase-like glycosyltransferase
MWGDAMNAPAPPALFDQLLRGWRGYTLVALIAVCSALFGATRMPIMDIDEARFAQASRQMVESGDYVRIRLQDAERNRKPVGIYWLQAASVHALSPFTDRVNTIWPYRLPSALGLVLAALSALWAGQALFGARVAVMGAGLYASGLLAGLEGMTAKTDSVLVGFTTLAIAALARLRFGGAETQPRLLALVFWGALACGVMIKGFITPLAAVLTLLALFVWERNAKWMKPLAWWPGPLLAMAIAAPWLIAIGVVTEGRFYYDLIATELGPKVVGGDHAHRGAPGYFLLLLPLLIFPATYALPAAARVAWRALRASANDDAHAPMRFALAWAVPTFLAFEIFPTKLVHYTLPVYPAIALICAVGLGAMRGRRWRTTHPAGLALFAVIGALIVALTAYAATFIPGAADADLRRAIATVVVGGGIVVAAIAGLSLLRRSTYRAAVLIVCGLALSFILRDRIVPDARHLFVTNEAVAVLTRTRLMPEPGERFWVVGYTQPSLVFMTQTDISLVNVEEAAAGVQAGDTIVIEGRELQSMLAALAARALRFQAAAEPARGVALGRGEQTTLHIGRLAAMAPSDGPADARPQNREAP